VRERWERQTGGGAVSTRWRTRRGRTNRAAVAEAARKSTTVTTAARWKERFTAAPEV
jgi:hypothetical protein